MPAKRASQSSQSTRSSTSSTSTMTAEAQAAITPEGALDRLRKGNRRFVRKRMAERDLIAQVRQTATGQFPFAVVISCIDSRAPAELLFDLGIGDIFNVRIAGNVVNEDILGSVEFACKLAGSKLILVLGHTSCGAVKGACDDVELGNLTGLLAKLGPAIDSSAYDGDRSSKNATFVDQVCEQNVRLTARSIPRRSPVLRALIADGKCAVRGALYDVRSGKVEFLD